MLKISHQLICSVLRKQLFVNTCTLPKIVVVVPLILVAYNSTVFVLEILTFVLCDGYFKFQISFNYIDVDLALPICHSTSGPDIYFLSTSLPRYVKVPPLS